MLKCFEKNALEVKLMMKKLNNQNTSLAEFILDF